MEKFSRTKLIEGIYGVQTGVWLSKHKTLVISDLHIGYEEALNKEGILVPRRQFKLTKKILEKMFRSVKPKTIIINGDLKHEFGTISQQEWRETLKVFDLLSKNSEEVILVKGNHDTFLEPLAKKRNLRIVNYYCVEEICITHGHKIWENKEFLSSKIIIIANEHPAVSIKEGVKSETFKCFLLGKWRRKKLIVMPSLLPIVEGSDIKKERVLSPYLKQKLADFEVFVLGERIYKFGKLKKI